MELFEMSTMKLVEYPMLIEKPTIQCPKFSQFVVSQLNFLKSKHKLLWPWMTPIKNVFYNEELGLSPKVALVLVGSH